MFWEPQGTNINPVKPVTKATTGVLGRELYACDPVIDAGKVPRTTT